MSSIPISPDIWQLAAQVCTERQLLILTLREKHGYSWNQIAITTNLTRATVRGHHQAATKNVYDALEERNGHASPN
jgi:transcriptional regulator